MLSNLEKIGMAFALVICCAILTLTKLALEWESLPQSQKDFAVSAGQFFCWILVLFSLAYSVFFVSSLRHKKFMEEMTEYNKRMAEQFNVGQVVRPHNFLDAGDYKRLGDGSGK